jgi:tripartite-type tricarboxylate transporter receptor subunit TctC
MSESGWPTVQMEDWWGLVGPAGLPDAVAARLETEARRLPAHPEVAGRLTAQGMEPAASSRAEMQSALTADVARFGRLIRDANIRPD